MEKFIKENIAILLIPIIALAGLGYWTYTSYNGMSDSRNVKKEKEELLATKKMQLEQIRAQKVQENEKPKKKVAASGKIIYEVLGQQFSPEASFGIMFENILANMTNNGVRIRSIDYNYQPMDDKVLLVNAPGYNACELSFTAVSTYSQLQSFFKNLAKENYLSSIYEVYIEPYDRDKTILISKFKIRLYTRTI